MSERLAAFSARLLEQSGCAVDVLSPLDLEVLLNAPAQQDLALGEQTQLHFGGTPPPNAQRVGFDGDWLTRCGTLLGARGRWVRQVLQGTPREPRDLDAAIARALVLENATWRLRETGLAWTRLLIVRLRVSARSDDRRDFVTAVAFNVKTAGALNAWEDILGALSHPAPKGADVQRLPAEAELPPIPGPAALRALITRAAPSRIASLIDPFVAGLQRRLLRDGERIFSYHRTLLEESVARAAAAQMRIDTGYADDVSREVVSREAARQEAIRREYGAAVAELDGKYALDVEVQPLQVLEVWAEVFRVRLRILRKKRERTIALDLLPGAKALTAPPCDAWLSTNNKRWACDEKLHLLGGEGAPRCATCDRAWCVLCTPKGCPRCARAA